MARKRLITILASTVLATGLAAAPATAQSLGDLTDAVEGTVERTTDTVDDAVESTTEAVEEATGSLGGATEAPSDDGDTSSGTSSDSAGDGSGDGGQTNVVEDTVEQATETVEDTVEQVTTTVEETVEKATGQVAPKPSPSDSSEEGGEDTDTEDTDTSGTAPIRSVSDDTGLARGGGVLVAESGPSRSARQPQVPSSGTTLAEAVAAFGSLGRSNGGGVGTSTGGSLVTGDVPSPEVAGPDAPSFEAFSGSRPVERPATAAAGPVGTTDPRATLLRVVAALLVLGTGVAATRAVEKA